MGMAGVKERGDSAVIIEARFKVAPAQHWSVKREYLRRFKIAFNANRIEISFPHLTVYASQDKKGEGPALP